MKSANNRLKKVFSISSQGPDSYPKCLNINSVKNNRTLIQAVSQNYLICCYNIVHIRVLHILRHEGVRLLATTSFFSSCVHMYMFTSYRKLLSFSREKHSIFPWKKASRESLPSRKRKILLLDKISLLFPGGLHYSKTIYLPIHGLDITAWE